MTSKTRALASHAARCCCGCGMAQKKFLFFQFILFYRIN